MLAGHTWLYADYYNTDGNYHNTWKAGFGLVSIRTTTFPPRRDITASPGWDYSFGGPHQSVLIALGDGSVHAVAFDVDPLVWKETGRR